MTTPTNNEMLIGERRTVRAALRAIPADKEKNKGRRIGGMIPFNSPSEIICDERGLSQADINALRAAGGCFREEIAPGAFNFTDMRALVDHRSWPVLGRTSAKTFRVEQKDDGLHYELDIPDSPSGDDLYCSVERGDVAGTSFDFGVRANGDTWDFSVRPPKRTLTAIDSSEISFVGTPAYPTTTAATMRNVINHAKETATRSTQAGSTAMYDQLNAVRMVCATVASACSAVMSAAQSNASMAQPMKNCFAARAVANAMIDAYWYDYPCDELAELVSIACRSVVRVCSPVEDPTCKVASVAAAACADACDKYAELGEANETIDDDADPVAPPPAPTVEDLTAALALAQAELDAAS